MIKPLDVTFTEPRYECNTFGQDIRKSRLEVGLRQKDLAIAISVNQNTVANWEHMDAML